ncbi:23S rRNA (guanosine(2251)-2'-O)-methyltransferase RlmB [Cyanobium sp. T1B-Tous]|uniref:23S rRNA (guanosine(2251)-2'-O)-methyltransferase RlmB n=1 Tax=Cyanobium sp. T1B-Tous TaxID=2823721 RepID=UPI0020CF4C34|nr:23S rRNA (guanosine(2251)-2'-O)-methyltransferase RlmB [Cyanobium sp. T1B-Tous]MCP9805899.1 23S rRNA (guanosine(2251)-2'-O)-methyltransferase RlmB [Cyanobium sp. T1B-Tous]
MSPRFERRPDKRTGAGGRGAGRPPRFSGPKPEWRRDGEQPRREGSSDRSSSRGERPPLDSKPYDRRPQARRGDGGRPVGRRPDVRRIEGGRPERPRFEAGRPDAGRPDAGRPEAGRFERGRPEGGRFERGRPDGSRFGGGRPQGRRFEGGRPTGGRSEGGRFGGSRFEGSRFEGSRGGPGRFAPKPLIVDADSLPPSGEAERHSVDPSTDLIWGRHPAQAALESGRPIHRVWCTPEMRFSPKFLQLLREAKSSGVLVEEVTWARLGQLTGGAVHQGIALQTAAAETLDLPTLIEGCASIGEPPLLMAVDGLTDPQNLGAIVRSAEALGAHGLVLPQRRSAGLTGSVAKVAAGALEHLPVARVVNLNRALDTLKQEGYRIVGLAAEGTVSLEEVDLEGPLVIVTGSEGDGLSMLTRRNCDQLVRIPLRGATPSLNASVATALLLYEVARRGWMKGLSGSQPAPRLVRPQLPAPAASASAPDTEVDGIEVDGMEVEGMASLGPITEPEIDVEAEPEESVEPMVLGEPTAPPPADVPVDSEVDLGLSPARAPGFWGDIQL